MLPPYRWPANPERRRAWNRIWHCTKNLAYVLRLERDVIDLPGGPDWRLDPTSEPNVSSRGMTDQTEFTASTALVSVPAPSHGAHSLFKSPRVDRGSGRQGSRSSGAP